MAKTLLFQGDSITDAGRDKKNHGHKGRGYVHLLSCKLDFEHIAEPWTIHNRGISGNRTKDLIARWQEDCIDLKPDFLSLYIGINNTWRKFDRDDPTPAEVFEDELNTLLQQVQENTACDMSASILLEPFVLDVPAGRRQEWAHDLIPKQAAVKTAASTFGMRFLSLQNLFDDALNKAPAERWAADGVHPTPAGHYLIAQAWYDAMQDIVGA